MQSTYQPAAHRRWMLALAALAIGLAMAVAACGGGAKDRKATLTTGQQNGSGGQQTNGAGEPSKKAAKSDKPKFGTPKEPPSGQAPEEPKGPNLGKPNETKPGELDKLEEKASKDGEVPVIIGLAVDAQAEGELDESAKQAQRDKIKSKRNDVEKDLQGTKHSALATFDAVPFTALRVSPEALEKLAKSPHVNGISEDRELKLDTDESSGGAAATVGNQYLADWWDFYRINADDSWANGYRGAGQTVAIVDTGVKSNHPWLYGKVVREYCHAYPNGCPNGSYEQSGAGSAAPCTYSTGCAHGTHVAGTAASTNGVAADAQIIAVQVFHNTSVGPQYNESDLLWAMNYVYNQRGSLAIAALNMSVGDNQQWGTCNDTSSGSSFYAWTQTLRSANIGVVVASGNNDYASGINRPACNTNTTSVGNSTLTTSNVDAVYGRAAGGSNSSSNLDLLAPGTHICSSVTSTNNPECGWLGTSMAAPHVTGAMATLKQLKPWLTVSQMETALQASGVGVYDDRNGITRTRIDVWNALIYAYNH